jgi:hypothetical protein
MENIKELLPIGSVVKLKDATKRLMITGVIQTDIDGNDYDYIAVLYPEGNVTQETQFLFQHTDIEDIIFRGYEDDEREGFLNRLAEFYSK